MQIFYFSFFGINLLTQGRIFVIPIDMFIYIERKEKLIQKEIHTSINVCYVLFKCTNQECIMVYFCELNYLPSSRFFDFIGSSREK